jgi:hypothetical protein
MRRISHLVGLVVLVACSESGGPEADSEGANAEGQPTGGRMNPRPAQNDSSDDDSSDDEMADDDSEPLADDADDEPADDEPAEPTDDEPADDEPADDEPAEPVDDEPADDDGDPVADDVEDEPADDEPAEPVDDGPADDEPVDSPDTPAEPRPPVDATCDLPDAAFCDTFTERSPGGRAGDLDDSKWSFSRLGFGCESSFSFPPTPINLCGVWETVDPSGPDSQFCVDENNDPHWTEGFDDNQSFNYIAARIRQPFDFEGRTSTIQWEADARTSGSHGWWVETWITEDPVPGANVHDVQVVTSKEAVGIELALNCGAPAAGLGTAGSGKVGVSRIMVIHDYVVTDVYDPFSGANANARCVDTEQGVLNKLQFKMSQNRIEVWATDAGGTELERIAEADVDLPFSRGYVHISHVHYNAHKAEVTSYQSYQWARIAFDGPVLPTPRAYEIPDAMSEAVGTNGCDPGFRISYGVVDGITYDLGGGLESTVPLVFEDVDPEGGIAARVNFNTTFVEPGNTLRFRLNGKAWTDYVVPELATTWERQGFSVPLPVADLVAGDNTLEIATDTASFALPPNGMHIANIDLEVEVP